MFFGNVGRQKIVLSTSLHLQEKFKIIMTQSFIEFLLSLLGGSLSELYQQGKISLSKFFFIMMTIALLGMLIIVVSVELASPGYFINNLQRSIAATVMMVLGVPSIGTVLLWTFSKKKTHK